MCPLEAAIALACIVSQADIDTLPCSPATLQAVAVSMELLDARECKYVFMRMQDVGVDFRLIHRRYQELKGAPPLADASRWPDRERIREWIGVNRSYVAWLEEHKLLFRDDWIDEAIEEANRLHRIFDLMCDARCSYYYITVRRKALLELREAVGPNLYYAGALPAIVPVWYFRRIDD